jgi:hypothetical protein
MIGEFSDRVPEEACEPHDELVVEVHIALQVGVHFDEPPDPHTWVKALLDNVMQRINDPSWVGLLPDDLMEWAVMDAVKPEPLNLEEYIEQLIGLAASGNAGPASWIADDIRTFFAKEEAG